MKWRVGRKTQEPARAGKKLAKFLFRKDIIQRKHGNPMSYFCKLTCRRSADPSAWAIGPYQMRKPCFYLHIAASQRVILGVADQGGVEFVISAVMLGNFGRKTGELLAGLVLGKLFNRLLRDCSVHSVACPSKLVAAARAASVMVSPASIRAISSRREAESRARASVIVRPFRLRLKTCQWASPRAATCGLCVITRTCTRFARRANRSPTAAAVAPPISLSTSSKISVGIGNAATRTTFNANISRDSSPPEATRANGPGGWPGLVAMRKRALSVPWLLQSASVSGRISTKKRAFSKCREGSSLVSCCSRRCAASLLASASLAAASQ